MARGANQLPRPRFRIRLAFDSWARAAGHPSSSSGTMLPFPESDDQCPTQLIG